MSDTARSTGGYGLRRATAQRQGDQVRKIVGRSLDLPQATDEDKVPRGSPPARLAMMRTRQPRSVLWWHTLCLGALTANSLAVTGRAAVDFDRDIRPILADRCYPCHGPDDSHREADLRLDLEQSVTEDRGGYAVVAPGKVAESELWRRLTSDDPDERMPPAASGKTLAPDEIEQIRQWIEGGAEWSSHWSYRRPIRHPLPAVRDTAWPKNWIDHFILHRLEAEGVPPRPAADPITLARRLCLDLTGLPPTPQQLQIFLADRSPAGYEQFVDSLLASPAYGERMAMYWLDLVRYADTVGYHGDQDHPISPYRDYVIEAFHSNMPFDQFTREQLAGDLLPGSGRQQQIATAYHRVLQTSHEGGIQPKEYRAIYAADRVRNLSAVWMAATLGCAQCHDHKYDPFTAADFYRMAAFFADIDDEQHFTAGTDTVPTARPPVLELLTEQEARQLASLTEQSAAAEDRQRQLNMTLIADGAADFLQVRLAERQASETRVRSVRQAIDQLHRDALQCMITVPLAEPRVTRILSRGNWLDESGPVVEPDVPAILGKIPSPGRRRNRQDLANWLTDASGAGGLTARVYVNRLWYLLLGRGLAATLDNFGSQGKPPTHPHLLDNLAIEFMQHHWDTQFMVKSIVLSQTYQQRSIPDGELTIHGVSESVAASFPMRTRLPAEMVRDSALLISGLLNRQVGGRSVRPYQPAGYYRHLNFPERDYQPDTDARQWRRGLYIHWQRQFLHPMLKALDAPSREECTAARQQSNTPLAALVLLNDPTFVEAARVFAQRMVCEGGSTFDERLAFGFQWTVSRPPRPLERTVLKKYWDESFAHYTSDRTAAHQLVSVGQAPRGGEVPEAELAAWTALARVLLNLDEAITRN